MLDDYPIIFTNKRSEILFDCDLMNGEQQEKLSKINKPCFFQVKNQDGFLDFCRPLNPMDNAASSPQKQENMQLLSLKDILL